MITRTLFSKLETNGQMHGVFAEAVFQLAEWRAQRGGSFAAASSSRFFRRRRLLCHGCDEFLVADARFAFCAFARRIHMLFEAAQGQIIST